MTKKLYSMFAMFGLFLALAASSAQAQPGDLLNVNVPFDFQIGSKTLPAGEYTVKRLSQSTLLFRSADGTESAIAQAMENLQAGWSEKEAKERLVFHQYGGQYYLAQVWMTRDGDGRALKRSKEERRAAEEQNLAAGGKKLRKVEVAAHAR